MVLESVSGEELEKRIGELQVGKLKAFAALVEEQQIERLKATGVGCDANIYNSKVSIKPGKKYIKVDVGSSGKFMIDAQGNIFGIKAYGVIHTGHAYGTLDTTDSYYWGDYSPIKKVSA